MIAPALAVALAGTVPVEAVVASIRCDWRDAAAVRATGPAEATLLLRLVDGAVPVDGGGSDEGRTVTIRLDDDDPALDCAPESRLAAPVVPIASLAPGETARGWFVLTRLGDGRVTAVAVRDGEGAQGFEVRPTAGQGYAVKRVVAVRRKRCIGRVSEQVCY